MIKLKDLLTEGNKFNDVYKDYGFEVEKKSGGLTYWAHYGSDISGHKNSYIRGELSGWTDGKKAAVGDDRGRESFSNPKAMAKWFEKNFKMKKESVNESDLGLTLKKGKTVKVTHKSSGKELIVIDKPNVRKEYEKIGYFAESVNEAPAAYSSPEAKQHLDRDIGEMSKHLGKASQQVIKIMMNGVKGGRYDAMDIPRGIETGPLNRTHEGERPFMKMLWRKVRDGFRRYSKGGKLRR